MVFSDLAFIFFLLPVFIALDFVLRSHAPLRNLGLIAVSLVFYAYDGKSAIVILLAYGLLNFLFVKGAYCFICPAEGKRTATGTVLLTLGITLNLAGLFYYKYAYWILSLFPPPISNLLDIKPAEAPALPLGISFFTFHAISFLVDISTKRIVNCPTALQFLTYFFMFPHLVAGPIVRFEHVQKEVAARTYTLSLFNYGVWRFILGVNKKILIANSVAPIADLTFALDITRLSSPDLILGAVAYMLQIYFDFSAYSDMAIGLAAMAGFKFHENFNSPYQAISVRDFWRRWHISLSTWLKNYVYIPLGGSRCSKAKLCRNLLIVFVLCGLWHGANATFLVWGLYHGAFLILERTPVGSFLEKWPYLLKRTYLLVMVMVGWVFFRAESLGDALNYLKTMCAFTREGEFFDLSIGAYNYAALILGTLLALYTPGAFKSISSLEGRIALPSYLLNALLLPLSLACLYLGSRNPFIYFNF